MKKKTTAQFNGACNSNDAVTPTSFCRRGGWRTPPTPHVVFLLLLLCVTQFRNYTATHRDTFIFVSTNLHGEQKQNLKHQRNSGWNSEGTATARRQTFHFSTDQQESSEKNHRWSLLEMCGPAVVPTWFHTKAKEEYEKKSWCKQIL